MAVADPIGAVGVIVILTDHAHMIFIAVQR